MKIRSSLALLLILLVSFMLFAEENDENQPGSKANYNSKEVIQRLSYTNFKNIKLLSNAIYNYGKGDEQFDLLVKTYSEASALYFSKEYDKSAKKFQENEKQIIEIATEIASKYKDDTSELQQEIIEKNVKNKVKLSDNDYNATKDKYVSQSSQAIIKANDYFDRIRPIQAIQQYRISRDRILNYLYIEADELPQETIDKCKNDNSKDKYSYEKCLKEAKLARRDDVRKQYEKIIQDNKNEKFKSKEKEN